MGTATTETLGQHERRFMRLLTKLLEFAYTQPGYELAGGELQRTPAQAALDAQHGSGIANSLHILCCAIDLKLFINGVYQTDSAAYKVLGDYWKTLDPACAWGGDFTTRADGNHFSLSWGGIR